jgi:hypothetical protein
MRQVREERGDNAQMQHMLSGIGCVGVGAECSSWPLAHQVGATRTAKLAGGDLSSTNRARHAGNGTGVEARNLVQMPPPLW